MAEAATLSSNIERLQKAFVDLGYMDQARADWTLNVDFQQAWTRLIGDFTTIAKVPGNGAYTPQLGRELNAKLNTLKTAEPNSLVQAAIHGPVGHEWSAMQSYVSQGTYLGKDRKVLRETFLDSGFSEQLVERMPAVVAFIENAPQHFDDMNAIRAAEVAAAQKRQQETAAQAEKVGSNPTAAQAVLDINTMVGVDPKKGWCAETQRGIAILTAKMQNGVDKLAPWPGAKDGVFSDAFYQYINDNSKNVPDAYLGFVASMAQLKKDGIYKPETAMTLAMAQAEIAAMKAAPGGQKPPQEMRSLRESWAAATPPKLTDTQSGIVKWVYDTTAKRMPQTMPLLDEIVTVYSGFGMKQLLPGAKLDALPDRTALPADAAERLAALYKSAMGDGKDAYASEQYLLSAVDGLKALPFGSADRRNAFRDALGDALEKGRIESDPDMAAQAFAQKFMDNVNAVYTAHGKPVFDTKPPVTVDPRLHDFKLAGGENLNDIIKAYNELNKGRTANFQHEPLVFKDADGKAYIAGIEDGSNIFTVMAVDTAEIRAAYGKAAVPEVRPGMTKDDWNAMYAANGRAVAGMRETSPSYKLAMESYSPRYGTPTAFPDQVDKAQSFAAIKEKLFPPAAAAAASAPTDKLDNGTGLRRDVRPDDAFVPVPEAKGLRSQAPESLKPEFKTAAGELYVPPGQDRIVEFKLAAQDMLKPEEEIPSAAAVARPVIGAGLTV